MLSVHVLHAAYAVWCFALSLCTSVMGLSVGSGAHRLKGNERVLVLSVTGSLLLTAMALTFYGYVQVSAYLGEK